MPATIGSETFNSIAERGIRLEGTQVARKFALGSWVKLRIGARLWISDVGTPGTGSLLNFGLCSGTTNLPGDQTCTHFVGMRAVTPATGAKGATYTRTTSANSYVQWASSVCASCKLVGSTHTDLSGGTTSGFYYWGPTGTSVWRMTTMYLQFERVSASQMTLRGWITGSFAGYGATSAPSQAQFAGAMLVTDPASILSVAGQATTLPTRTNQAVNESVDGTLDTVVIGWDMAYPYMYLNDLAVSRLE